MKLIWVCFISQWNRKRDRELDKKREEEWDYQENYFKLTRADNDRA